MSVLKILLVEDNDDDCYLARRAISKSGIVFEMETAANGVTALERLNNGPPDIDLMLLDIQMPKVSGIDVLEKLRQKAPPHLPIIAVLSASNSSLDIKRCLDLGAVDFLHKPMTVKNFSDLARRLGFL